MTSKSLKKALDALKKAHQARFGAAWGKRCCTYEHAEDCLGIAKEEDADGKPQFRHKMCMPCYRVVQQTRYLARKADKPPAKRGRPPGRKDLVQRKSKTNK